MIRRRPRSGSRQKDHLIRKGGKVGNGGIQSMEAMIMFAWDDRAAGDVLESARAGCKAFRSRQGAELRSSSTVPRLDLGTLVR